eukprot:366015-Chlamydomonas_euryale.AAC.7
MPSRRTAHGGAHVQICGVVAANQHANDELSSLSPVLCPQPRTPHLGTYNLKLRPDNLPKNSRNPLPPSVDQKRLPQNIRYGHILCPHHLQDVVAYKSAPP